jgi:hypothetical protein
MANFWCSDCGRVYVSVAGERCRPCQKKIENEQGESTEVTSRTTCVSNKPKAFLQMFLDADRDGTVDPTPTDYDQWEWGEEGTGAIIMVKKCEYADDTDVDERSEIQFKWEADKERPQQWQASLEVDFEDRIKFYPSTRADATALDFENKTINLKNLQFDDHGRIRLWMEAADFGVDTQEDSWRVTLTFTFEAQGGIQERQCAQLRIAPWIMANDLDPTEHVFARRNTRVEPESASDSRTKESNLYATRYNYTSEVIERFAGDSFTPRNIPSTDPRKGFARDVMRSGYTTSPKFSGKVILKCRDPESPALLRLLSSLASRKSNSGLLKDVISDITDGDVTGQDMGGNFMVSPPTDAYPFGRILYGHSEGNECHFRDFFNAQKVQAPIAINTGWLSVGHVDEMLSFVRGSDGEYYALLMSPRLAYIMVAASAKRPLEDSVGDTITWAVNTNNACIEAGDYSREEMLNQIGDGPNEDAPSTPTTLHGVDGYVENPDAPDLNRAVVFRTASISLANLFNGRGVYTVFPNRVLSIKLEQFLGIH